MSYVVFGTDPLKQLVETAGSAGKLSLLIGAGASMEAGLPSWEDLVQRLLVRAAKEHKLIDVRNTAALKRWEAEAARDGYLGAAAIVDALAGPQRDEWLKDALFGASDPTEFFPGAISQQIPALHDAFGGQLKVMTTNYDDLIEQAFRDAGTTEPFPIATANHQHPAAACPIFHLHGHVTREREVVGDLVLSEADYHRMRRWQGDLVRSELRGSVVIFIGSSLIDPNLLRYLHGVEDAPQAAYAVFVRQGTYDKDVPKGIPPAREKALCARWEALGVTPVFVDHYTDVAQVLYEIGRHRRQGDDYKMLDARAAEWVRAVERNVFGFQNDKAFVSRQLALRQILRSALDGAVSAATTLTPGRFDKTLQCSLWLADEAGEHLTTWLLSDRVHVERQTMERVPVSEHSNWAAIRTFCRGTPLAEPRNVYASRWRFVRAAPLIVDAEPHGRIPVGSFAVSSRTPRERSRLAKLEGDVQQRFSDTLERAIINMLGRGFA